MEMEVVGICTRMLVVDEVMEEVVTCIYKEVEEMVMEVVNMAIRVVDDRCQMSTMMKTILLSLREYRCLDEVRGRIEEFPVSLDRDHGGCIRIR